MRTDKTDLKINYSDQHPFKQQFDPIDSPKKQQTYFLVNSFVALTIYLFTFFLWFYLKRGTFFLDEKYIEFLGYYLISLFAASVLSNKAFLTRKHEYMQSLRKIYISVLLSLGFLSLILLINEASTLSRYVIIGSMLTGSILESVYFYIVSENKSIKTIIDRNPVSIRYTIPDLVLLVLVVYFVIVKSIGIYYLNERHQLTIVLIFISWIIAALFTHRFNPLKQSLNNWSAAGLQIKFYLLILSFTSLVVFALNLRSDYWPQFIEGVSIYSVISFSLFLFLYVRKLPYKTDEVTNIFLKAFELGKPAIAPKKSDYLGKFRFISSVPRESIVKQKLQFQYFKDFPEVFDFLERELELKSFDARKTIVLRSADNYNIKVLENASTELLINLHEINDIKRINDYFRLLNEKIVKNGIFAGCLIPIKFRQRQFQKKYPFMLASLFYFFDFVWRRIFPKIPLLRKIYFGLSKGKNRAISLAEALGRLVYCGFEIIDLTEVNDYIYFVSKKVKDPSTDKNPSYSPIFKMRRIGKDGKQIFVYKIRTMHPYSEYIQELIYDKNKLSEGGKFNYDFRISSWGKVLRKLWIDELPMLINYFRGDIKLVGVRPVSNHYLSLYSDEFRKRRIKYKPGLIPPFYADMPKTIDEIEQSEKNYFDSFDNSPFITDIKYFVKIFFNILFHSRRSA